MLNHQFQNLIKDVVGRCAGAECEGKEVISSVFHVSGLLHRFLWTQEVPYTEAVTSPSGNIQKYWIHLAG